ncbi:hypothetical protein FISHEDRAFT_9583, partial [Fistulina hepatica ATCC 64428]
LDWLEEYLQSVEDAVYWLAAGIPDARDTFNRMWTDVSRYGAGMPEFHTFEIPAPPLLPPPPPTFYERSWDWTCRNPRTASAIAAGLVGAGALIGYRTMHSRRTRRARVAGKHKSSDVDRRQVVIVLGGDSPLGLPLIKALEKRYIVVASVSTPEAVDALERQCGPYFRALILDSHVPATVPVFLRTLASTLTRRFPLTTSGDPFVPLSSQPYVVSVVSLLTIPSDPIYSPLENLPLQDAYMSHLSATHVTPIQVIQALLPVMRTGPHAQDRKTIIVCLPSPHTYIGLPFASAQAMSSAATLRAIEILRREIAISAMSGKTDVMKKFEAVVVDIGAFNVNSAHGGRAPDAVCRSMDKWTASEKMLYGPSFIALSQPQPSRSSAPSWWTALISLFREDRPFGVSRKTTDVRVFVDRILSVISAGQSDAPVFGIRFGPLINWLRGARFSVGAGASTYRYASFLPSFILNALLNLPHYLISKRDALLPPRTLASSP